MAEAATLLFVYGRYRLRISSGTLLSSLRFILFLFRSSMYVCLCLYVCMHVCMRVCIYVCMHICMYAFVHVYTHICMYVCMYICMYVCMHVGTRACVCFPYLLLCRNVTRRCVSSGRWDQDADVYWLRGSSDCNTQSKDVNWVAAMFEVGVILCKFYSVF